MAPEDAEEFAQSVYLRIIEKDYEVFRQFSGRSTLRTYLRVVVKRQLLDWQNSRYGKWRPTAAATRLGRDAVDLERMIHRDSYTADEAIQTLIARSASVGLSGLKRIVERLPFRPRRRMVSVEAATETLGVAFNDPIDARERQHTLARIRATLARALERLSSEDRRLIALRYSRKYTVQTLARQLQVDPKALYRRFEHVHRVLRSSLVEDGVTGPSMVDTH
jgi:RNA polymerase sigma factor (sigma-70 family)